MQDRKMKDQKETKDVSAVAENAGPIIQKQKMQDQKMRDLIAGVEMKNAGPEMLD